jgi:hypothetical protein
MSTTFSPTDAEVADALAELHTRTVDARAGFETMVSRAEPAFHPIAQRFCDLHGGHASRLAQMLVDFGRTPDADGSFMTTVNRTVVATRALVDEIDADGMDQVRSGEEHVTRAFDAGARRLAGTEHEVALREMRGELEALLRETAGLDAD